MGVVQAEPKQSVKFKGDEVPIWLGNLHFKFGSERRLEGKDYFQRFEEVKKKEIDDKIKSYRRSLAKNELSQAEYDLRSREVNSLFHPAFIKNIDSSIGLSPWYSQVLTTGVLPFFKDNPSDTYHKDLVGHLYQERQSLQFDKEFHKKSVEQFARNNFIFAPSLKDDEGMGYLSDNREGAYYKQTVLPAEKEQFDELLDAIDKFRHHNKDGNVPNQVVGINVILFDKQSEKIFVVMHNESANTFGFPQVFSSLPSGRCSDDNYWSAFFSELHEEAKLKDFDKLTLRSVIPVPGRDRGDINLYFFVELDMNELPAFAPGESTEVSGISFTDHNLPISIQFEYSDVELRPIMSVAPAPVLGLETKKSKPRISYFEGANWFSQSDDVFQAENTLQESRVEKGVIIIPRPDGLFHHNGADWIDIGESESLVKFQKDQLIKLMGYVDIDIEHILAGIDWSVNDLKAMAKDKKHHLRAKFDTYQLKAVQKLITGHSFEQYEKTSAIQVLHGLVK